MNKYLDFATEVEYTEEEFKKRGGVIITNTYSSDGFWVTYVRLGAKRIFDDVNIKDSYIYQPLNEHKEELHTMNKVN